MRYRAFKDECKLYGMVVPEHGCEITFYMPMPKSWSKKKKEAMDNKPHQSRPDIDNLIKSVLDAVYVDDSTVWQISAKKVWSFFSCIEIKSNEGLK